MSPKVTLISSYSLCAGHRLVRPEWTEEKNRRTFGKCANSHGHEYRLDVVLTGEISAETGMLMNGYDVDRIVREAVLDPLDHKFLNDDVPFFKVYLPSAEWIAVWVYGELRNKFPAGITVEKVVIYETPHLRAEYP